jgi:uncharacterized protein
MQKHERVSAQINLLKLPTNNIFEFTLDESMDWIDEILTELNENATEKSPEEYKQETSLKIVGEISKKNKAELGEYVTFKGKVSGEYVTECVRTLKPMKINLDFDLKICFIDEALAKTELYEDVDETYVENDVYQVYFYQKRSIDLKETLHEQIFLNVEPYPILDADSKLEGTLENAE